MLTSQIFKSKLSFPSVQKLFGSSRAFATPGFNYQLLQLDEVRSGLREAAEKFS
jgi:hypothetical protein